MTDSNKAAAGDVSALERELVGLCDRRDALAARLEAAENEVVRTIGARRDLLTAGDVADDRQVAKLSPAVHVAEGSVTAVNDALDVVTASIASAETKVAAERDRIARSERADAELAVADRIQAALATYHSASRRALFRSLR